MQHEITYVTIIHLEWNSLYDMVRVSTSVFYVWLFTRSSQLEGWLLGDLGHISFHRPLLWVQRRFAESGSAAKSKGFQTWNADILWVMCVIRDGSSLPSVWGVVKLPKCIGEAFYILVIEITKILWDQLRNAKPEK